MLNSIRFFLLASGVCVLSGCGGEEAVETSDTPASNEAAAANFSDPAKDASAAPKKFARAGDDDDPEEDDLVTAETPQVPENTPESTESTPDSSLVTDLPNSLEAWTDDHFVLAVRWRDARLTEAISIRAKSDLHRPTFVSLAKQLLQIATEPPEEPPEPEVVTADAIRDDDSGGVGAMTPGKLSVKREYDNDDDDGDDDDPGRRGGFRGLRPQSSGNTREYDNDDDDGDDDDPGRRGGFTGITPPPPAAGSSNQPNSAVPTSASETLAQRRIVQAVVQGLLVNDSAEAWDTLQAVLSHQQQTPLDLKQASIVVFEEVFGSEQINVAMAEKLAVFVLNSPDQMQVGMNLLTSLASQISRMNLHLTGVSQTPPAVLKPTPATGRRNSVRVTREYDNDDDTGDDDDPGRRGGFRGITLQPSAGNPNPTNSAAPVSVIQLPPLNLSPEALEASTDVLHGSTFLDTLKETLETTRDLSSGRPTLLLASMLPDVKLRHVMYNVLSDKHHRGAEKLLGVGFYSADIVHDPVHLLVLKSLPRHRKGSDGSAQTDALGRAGVTWAQATLEMVLSVRDQLRQAAKNNPELAWDEKVPLRLHRRAIPDVSIQLTIEDGSDTGDEASAGTQVYYSRCSVMPADDREIKKLIAHYEGQSKGIRRPYKEKGMLWFDGIQAGPNGTRMTKDVLISQGFGGAGQSQGQGNSGPGQNYVVETITIVAADPRLSQEPEKPAEAATE